MGRSLSRPNRARVLLATLLTTWVVAPGGAPRVRADESSKFLARRTALLIEQFTRFIEWPADALPAEGPFVLCLQGSSDTAQELTAIASIRKFKRRNTQVRRLKAGDGHDGCHVLYLAGSEANRLGATLAEVAGKPVLTVSDTVGFVEHGVHFNFFPVTRAAPAPGTYPQFEWSVPAIRRTMQLRFDPGLLSQGRKVDEVIGHSGRKP
jgi:hypothetical protein